jgi:hypothetical protein
MSEDGRMHVIDEAEAQALIHLGPPFRLTHGGYGLELAGGTPPIQAFAKALLYLKVHADRLRFLRGDLILLVESNHGEEASQIIDDEYVGDLKEANADRFVSKGVAPDLRLKAKSWAHAKEVAHLKPEKQAKFLQMSLDEDWIPSKLKSEIAAAGSSDKTGLRFLLVVDAKSEAKQKELAKKLEAEGFAVTLRSSVKKEPKAAKEKKGKKGEVTARKRRGAPKAYTRRRTPTGPPRS